MSLQALVAGALFRAGEQRTSASGRRYWRATLKTAAVDNGGADFFDLMVFSETAAAELSRLEVGERLTVQGALKLEIYAPEGKPPRISRTVFVDHILALRSPPKQRKPKSVPAGQTSAPERVNIMPSQAGADLDDKIPF